MMVAAPAPRISIALATYNGSAFLQAQLDSLAAQTRLPFELVVSDDRSTDDTVAILASFVATAPFPVRVSVNEAQLGWRANFMRAASLCTGDVIAFCDQDDLWYPEKLARVAEPFDAPDVLLVHHNADLVDASGAPYGTLSPIESGARRIATLSRPTDWSNPLGLVIAFRRWLTRFDDLWPTSVDLFAPGHRAAHDQWFYYLATNLGDVVALPDRLLGYRQHGKNSVGWTQAAGTRELLEDAAATRDQLERTIAMLGPFCRVLEEAARRDEGETRSRLERARAVNERYLAKLEDRRALYAPSRFGDRLATLARLLQRRGYDQKRDWGFGRRALLSDATRGLFRGGA